MSNIPLPPILQNSKVDTYTRNDGADVVHVQAMVPTNPWTEVSGTLAANGQSVSITEMVDADGMLVTISGTFSGSIAFEASVNGTDWYSLLMSRASSGTGELSRALTGTTLEAYRANIAGWTRFRVRCSAYTSGTATIRLLPVALAFEPPMNSTIGGTVTANAVAQNNVFYNDSVTAQAANATVTGTARDVAVAAGTVHRYSAFNASAFSDQAGTLRIECSNDNVTWRRASADTAVAANSVIYLSVPVMTRYHRVVYVNGATIQGAFMLNSSFTAA
jgi:hypothetical protein